MDKTNLYLFSSLLYMLAQEPTAGIGFLYIFSV